MFWTAVAVGGSAWMTHMSWGQMRPLCWRRLHRLPTSCSMSAGKALGHKFEKNVTNGVNDDNESSRKKKCLPKLERWFIDHTLRVIPLTCNPSVCVVFQTLYVHVRSPCHFSLKWSRWRRPGPSLPGEGPGVPIIKLRERHSAQGLPGVAPTTHQETSDSSN